ALLVDGLASRDDAWKLREALVFVRSKRVELLVSTHYFSDHLAAWGLFPEAAVLAHRNAPETFRSEDFRTDEEAAHYRPPTLLLPGSLERAWGRYRIGVAENPGHTADARLVDFPDADLLHVGDAAVGRLAYLHYASPESIDRALEQALARGR